MNDEPTSAAPEVAPEAVQVDVDDVVVNRRLVRAVTARLRKQERRRQRAAARARKRGGRHE